MQLNGVNNPRRQHVRAVELIRTILVNVNIDEHDPNNKKFVDNPSDVFLT